MHPADIAVSPPLPAHGFAGRIAEHYRLWRERRRWIGEMANAASLGRLDDVLNDVGLTRAELDLIAEGPVDAGRQFETLAGLAEADLPSFSPAVLREAMWKCTRCAHREACQRWLRTGEWHAGEDMRCPNAALFRH